VRLDHGPGVGPCRSADPAGYHTTYNDRIFLPKDCRRMLVWRRLIALLRCEDESRIVMVEANHDLRNPADF